MHVLIPVLHRPSKPTGVCRHAINLARCLALRSKVSRVTLVIGEWQEVYFETAFKFDSPKIKIASIKLKNTSFSRNRWFIFGLPKLAKKLQSDLIHLSFPFPFIRQWFDVPIVASIHDLYPYECPENFGYPRVWFNQLFLQQCVRNSDGLICVSQCTLKALNNYFPQIEKRKKVTVIYNTVDLDNSEPQVPHLLINKTLSYFLLTVAQHRKNKNLDLLIQAYSILLREKKLLPTTKLLLIGSSGPETNNLIQLVKTLELDDRVLFLSNLQDEELHWLYKNASLFVIPSSTEGFCLPLAEALSLSCPAVCSDIPIFREVGSTQCRYFKLEGDICHNLAVAISSELSSIKYQQRPVDDRFLLKEVSQKLLDYYLLF